MCYSLGEDAGLFFVRRKFMRHKACGRTGRLPQGESSRRFIKKENTSSETEVNILRTRITLACTECKQRNYSTTKDKKVMPDRMEIKKYCKFCKAHTLHKETK